MGGPLEAVTAVDVISWLIGGGIAAGFFRGAHRIGKLEERLENMRTNCFPTMGKDICDLREEFRAFRSFVIEKFT